MKVIRLIKLNALFTAYKDTINMNLNQRIMGKLISSFKSLKMLIFFNFKQNSKNFINFRKKILAKRKNEAKRTNQKFPLTVKAFRHKIGKLRGRQRTFVFFVRWPFSVSCTYWNPNTCLFVCQLWNDISRTKNVFTV